MTQPDTSKPAPILFAHRGASAYLPENTLEAFSAGLEQGASAIELDLQCTQDNVIVVFHDENGQRMAGINKAISETPYKKIKQWQISHDPLFPLKDQALTQSFTVPTLEDVLHHFPHVLKNIDIKKPSPKIVDLVVNIIKNFKATENIVLTSEFSANIKQIHTHNYDGILGSSRTDVARARFLPKAFLKKYCRAGSRVQIPVKWRSFRFDTKSFIDKCHYAGLLVDFWVINDSKEAQRLLSLGADGIMTDDPAALQHLFASSKTKN